jgi:hypothetical protein
MLHDTTEFNYHRDGTSAIGILHKDPVRRKSDGTLQHTIVGGPLMPSSLTVTTDGLPLDWRDHVLEQRSGLRMHYDS